MNGRMRLRSSTSRSASWRFSMGPAKWALNFSVDPRRPGAAMAKSDHSSSRLFSIGVPVMATLNGTESIRARRLAWEVWFLTNCASSRNRPDQATDS